MIINKFIFNKYIINKIINNNIYFYLCSKTYIITNAYHLFHNFYKK